MFTRQSVNIRGLRPIEGGIIISIPANYHARFTPSPPPPLDITDLFCAIKGSSDKL